MACICTVLKVVSVYHGMHEASIMLSPSLIKTKLRIFQGNGELISQVHLIDFLRSIFRK